MATKKAKKTKVKNDELKQPKSLFLTTGSGYWLWDTAENAERSVIDGEHETGALTDLCNSTGDYIKGLRGDVVYEIIVKPIKKVRTFPCPCGCSSLMGEADIKRALKDFQKELDKS